MLNDTKKLEHSAIGLLCKSQPMNRAYGPARQKQAVPGIKCAFRQLIAVGALVACLALPACQNVCRDRLLQTRQALVVAEQDISQVKGQLARAERTNARQKRQIEDLQALPGGKLKLETLVTTSRIELDRLTGGYDQDHDGQDDGIVVYIRPIDTDGHVIKAIGSLSIKLFDLNGAEPKLVGQVKIPASEARKLWFGRAWTHHFTVRCPFDPDPARSPITVQAVFVELLTGKEFKAQKLLRVKLQ